MIDDTIQRIEARLKSSEAMPDSTRAELLQLLSTLKAEVAQLPSSQADRAESIARAAEASTAQAVAPDRDEVTYRGALDELTGSVQEFEASHPRLVQVVNNLANTLAGMGI